ncbi:MAG: hypothetical protein JWM53_4288, partial [bacterium]|nr:hypothetical protein [bacterium]
MRSLSSWRAILLSGLLGGAGCLSSFAPAMGGTDGGVGVGGSDGTGGVGGGGGGGGPAGDAGMEGTDGSVAADGGATTSDGGVPLVPSPLPGKVSSGTWQYGDLPFTGIATGKFHYAYLMPSGYSSAYRYPILVYEHENTEGNSWYQNGGDPTQNTIVNQDVIDGVFNSVAFRTKYPAIIIVPFCDLTDGSAGSSGQNFGGYNDAPGKNVYVNAVVAVVQSFLSHYSAYPGMV